MNFAAEVSYNGGLFSGWQCQPGLSTVQEEIEKVLSLLNGSGVKITGAGRTDAGVHAKGQVCSFELDEAWRPDKLMLAVNANLPQGVQFMRVAEAPDNFNARFDAVSREYVYFMWHGRAVYPHLEPFVSHIKAGNYDWELAAQACRYLEGEHDFGAFCKKNETPENTVRTLHSARLCRRGRLVWLHVKGNAFLMNMIRIVLGNLELVAQKKRPPEWIAEMLENGDRESGGRTFPPNGLFFWRVNYREKLFC